MAQPTDWRTALDDYGRALLDFENRYEAQGHAAASLVYRLPSGLGPLPDELVDVASRLLQRSTEIEQRVHVDLEVISGERAAIARARTTWGRPRPTARFVDVHS